MRDLPELSGNAWRGLRADSLRKKDNNQPKEYGGRKNMTKIRVQDAARVLSENAETLLGKVAVTKAAAQEYLQNLRRLQDKLTRAEMQRAEEERRQQAEILREQQETERARAEEDQNAAIRAALELERERAQALQAAQQAAKLASEVQEEIQHKSEEEPPKPTEEKTAQAPVRRETEQASPAVRRPAAPQQENRPRPQNRQPFQPRPFVPNPNDPRAAVNRNNPNFRPQQGSEGGAPRQGGGPRQGQNRPPFQNRGDRGGMFDKDREDTNANRSRSQGSRQNAGRNRPDFLPIVEKERVSNYDPNKNNYQRNYDPEKRAPRSKKNVMRGAVDTGLDEEEYGSRKRGGKKVQRVQPKPEPVKIEKAYMTAETILVRDLSERLGKPAGEIIKKLFLLGIMATINQELDYDTANLVASEFGIELELKLEKTYEDVMNDEAQREDDESELVHRPPVVTIMGHVDHGKTSLLDKIRLSHVTDTEAGGITQHIGAYTVETRGEIITFVDTPGHEAFTAMRARGAQVTDIVVLVVAADDGIMPQTVEAINHSKAAKVPIIVAVNKIDKPTADVERIKQQLTEYELVAEEWGGDTQIVPVSALTGQGIDELLDTILLVAEVEDYRANPKRMAIGTIIEAELDKGRGPVATVLVQNGTLHTGDTIVAGFTYGRVRAMVDDKGKRVQEAGPSMPVEVIGFNEVPEAGDILNAVADDQVSRHVAEERRDRIRAAQVKAMQKTSLDDLFEQISQGQIKELNLIVKADVQGSVEAVRQALEKLSTPEVRVRVIHGAVGAINEADVLLASTAGAIIVGFNVRPNSMASAAAEREKVDIRMYRIIYQATEEIEAALKGMLAPKFREVILGHAQVRQTFRVSGVGTVAGSYVTDGVMRRNGEVRLLRDNVVIFEGKLSSLKRFKDDAREVATGYECGIGLENYNDVKENDVIECYIEEQIEN
ncbi:MAG: translation initiation factor IF-2 [Clostridia bacterium]|nr:translation initiation factor IF-2 [Clostridia bacterium]